MPAFLESALLWWRRIPFRHVILVTVFLFFWGKEKWGEHYPFTDFPMYSHLDAESDVLYVTDQSDNVLPFHRLFGTKTSTQKKNYMKALARITNADKRDSREARPEEQRKAGEEMVEDLMPKLKKDRLDAGTTALRFYYKVFRADGDKIVDTPAVLVAEHVVSPG